LSQRLRQSAKSTVAVSHDFSIAWFLAKTTVPEAGKLSKRLRKVSERLRNVSQWFGNLSPSLRQFSLARDNHPGEQKIVAALEKIS
jgi:hypothetical protein